MVELGLFEGDSVKKNIEHIPLTDSLTRIITEKTKIYRNRLVLTVDRNYFIQQGLPSVTYDIINYNINEINLGLKATDRPTRRKIVKSLKEWQNRRHEYQ